MTKRLYVISPPGHRLEVRFGDKVIQAVPSQDDGHKLLFESSGDNADQKQSDSDVIMGAVARLPSDASHSQMESLQGPLSFSELDARLARMRKGEKAIVVLQSQDG
ncbi:MAG: hypothetical protein LBQ20_11580 [Rhodanobacter sp.]|jgi:hypothetical protein|nr:hypothetical protein [Rhodanobacter sp.]